MASANRNLLVLQLLALASLSIFCTDKAFSIRIPDRASNTPGELSDQSLKTAVFALGSFWRSEAVFGCLNGVVRTTAGYAGGSKVNPEYRSLGDHAESVMVFGQGPDVGNQYRSIIFTNGTEEARLATMSQEREQAKSRTSIVTTQIQQLQSFYPAEPEHQKFELKRHPLLLQLIGNLPEEELEISTLAAKLNGYAAELCPQRIQKQINAKINEIIRRGWPVLTDV
ncbi:hypothetical protein V6N12_026119 [Hibiscus sabdariffa]|uniref:peptide-methionine (S)-S-oxide reductase n=1 Tax=Hibiscus sabdariffa TaxID=183260 RepID=A0ABR2DRV6_9ROSI